MIDFAFFPFQVDKEKVASIIAKALNKNQGSNEHLPDGRPVSSTPSSDNTTFAMQTIPTELTIHFIRADKGLGLSIAGTFTLEFYVKPNFAIFDFGTFFHPLHFVPGGLGSTPYINNDEGIFISRVTAGGPADIAGLKKDDKVLSVNGYNCIGIDHYEAVGILKAAGSTIDMKVIREIPVHSTQHQNGHQPHTPSQQQQQQPPQQPPLPPQSRQPRESTTSHDETVSLSSLSQPASSHSQKSLVNKSSPGVVSLEMDI